MKSKIFISALILLSFYFGHAQRDSLFAEEDSKIIAESAKNNFKTKLSTPFGTSSLPNLFSNVSVSSFLKEGINGKIELQGKFGSNWSGGLTLDQKIGKSDNQAIPLDLSGISPGTTLKFNVQKMIWKPKFPKSDSVAKEIEEVTKIYADRKNKDYRNIGLRAISIDGTEDEKNMAQQTLNSVSFKEPYFINAEIGFTKTSFSYTTDSFTLKENKDVYLSPTFKFSIVKALGNGFKVAGYLALSYNYSESYTAADDVTFTIPFGRTTNSYTNTLAFGKPAKKTSHSIIGEYRKNIFTGNNTNIAISPSITLGINSKKLSAFLPIYFIKGINEKGKFLDGLQSGVRLGYTTSTQSGMVSSFKDGFIAQLIISQPLDFLSKL